MEVIYCNDLATVQACYRAVRDSDLVAFDYETTGLDPHTDTLLLVQFGTGNVCYVVPYRDYQDQLAHIVGLLTERQRLTLAHNASFEYQFTLSHFGLHLARVYDTREAEAVLTAGLNEPLDLGAVVQRRLGLELDKGLQKSFIGADPETFLATPEQVAYAASDVVVLPDLYRKQKQLLADEGLTKTAALEFQALPVFAQMEYHGMKLDLQQHATVLATYKADSEHYGVQAAGVLDPYWQQVYERNRQHDAEAHSQYQAGIRALLDTIGGRMKKDSPDDVRVRVAELRKERDKHKPKPYAPINLNSGQQVLAALAESGISLPDLTADTVEDYAHESPVLAAYAKWAKAQKIVSTYGDSMAAKVNPKTGRLHGRYNQVVSTGRTSSSNPNMQNMPKAIRACFVPEPGNVFVVADFAAMEMRIAAGLYQDPNMLQAFNDGKDLHSMTAAAAWPDKFPTWEAVDKEHDEERAFAKTGNFASIYGASAFTLQARMGVPADAAKRIIDGISSLYRVMWDGIHADGEQAVHTGYAITALGRKRYFRRLPPQPHGWQALKDWRKLRSSIVRQAMNMPVQGTGADIAKRSMVLIYETLRRMGLDARIVGMVHDEILTECAVGVAGRVSAIVGESMKEAGAELIEGVAITADVHVVTNWTK